MPSILSFGILSLLEQCYHLLIPLALAKELVMKEGEENLNSFETYGANLILKCVEDILT